MAVTVGVEGLEPPPPSAESMAVDTEVLMAAPEVLATTVEPIDCTLVSFWLSVRPPLPPPPAVQLHEKFEPGLDCVPLMIISSEVASGTT